MLSFILLLGLAFLNCQKKKDKSNFLLLLGLNSLANQQTGNCASVLKENNIYDATLLPFPRGACNAGTLDGGTTVEEIKLKYKADFTSYISIINSEFAGQCVATKTKIEFYLTDAELNSRAEGRANELKNTRFFVIENLVEEGKYALINENPNDEIATLEDVKTLKPVSFEEFRKYIPYYLINIIAVDEDDSTCSALASQKIVQSFPSNQYSMEDGNYKKNTKIFGINCYYGDNLTANQQERKCATLKEKF